MNKKDKAQLLRTVGRIETQLQPKERVFHMLEQDKKVEKVLNQYSNTGHLANGEKVKQVRLFLDEKHRTVFVAISANQTQIFGFTTSVYQHTSTPIRAYKMQKTKSGQVYIMADSTKYPLSEAYTLNVNLVPAHKVKGVRPSGRFELYRPVASTEVVDDQKGIKWHVNIEVPLNEGANVKDPVVCFYDARYGVERNGVGQFVSSYYVSTLLTGADYRGLDLQGDVPDWKLTAESMAYVRKWLRSTLKIQKEVPREYKGFYELIQSEGNTDFVYKQIAHAYAKQLARNNSHLNEMQLMVHALDYMPKIYEEMGVPLPK